VQTLRVIIAKMQGCSTFEKFLKECHALVNKWDVVGKDIDVYLMRIHPRHWTIFGNLDTITDTYCIETYASILRTLFVQCEIMNEDQLNKVTNEDLFYNNIPIGKKFAIYGISRNNVSESAANAIRMSGIRYATPPLAIRLWLEKSNKVVMDLIVKVTKINPVEVLYSSIGMKFFNNAAVTNQLSVEKLGIKDGQYEIMVKDKTWKKVYKCVLTDDDVC
jgi:hypothetical protein